MCYEKMVVIDVNTGKFMELFPDIQCSFLGVFDIFSNMVFSVLVIFLNFFLKKAF